MTFKTRIANRVGMRPPTVFIFTLLIVVAVMEP